MSAVVVFEQVACLRGGRLLFEGLDFSAGHGEAIEIAGPNGAGKSSAIRLAAGLLRPDSGIVRRTARAELVDESLALDRNSTLLQALNFWARFDRPYAMVDKAMTDMGIAHLADVPVRLLSTGQRKRATVARLLSAPAPIWLLDEPLNGLDVDGVTRVTREVKTHLAGGDVVIVASHQPLDFAVTRRIEIGR